jgi:cell division protease FtsH
LFTKEYLENKICVALGGRISEEIVNGINKVTTGAQNDFLQCSNIAKMMVE